MDVLFGQTTARVSPDPGKEARAPPQAGGGSLPRGLAMLNTYPLTVLERRRLLALGAALLLVGASVTSCDLVPLAVGSSFTGPLVTRGLVVLLAGLLNIYAACDRKTRTPRALVYRFVYYHVFAFVFVWVVHVLAFTFDRGGVLGGLAHGRAEDLATYLKVVALCLLLAGVFLLKVNALYGYRRVTRPPRLVLPDAYRREPEYREA